MQMVDAPVLEDCEYRPTTAPKVSGDLDDPMRLSLKLNDIQPSALPFLRSNLK
jgi:hypothetical protein